MRGIVLATVVLAAASAGAQSAPAAPPTVDAILDALAQVTDFRAVAISPDARHVAWIESVKTKDGPASDRAMIFVADLPLNGQPPRRIRIDAKDHDDQELAWSPDGTHLAFLSDAEKAEQPQLYVADVATGKVQQLTHLAGHLENVQYAPRGDAISFLWIEGAADLKGPLAAAPVQTGVIDSAPKAQRIAVVPAGGGEVHAVSAPELFVYEYDWAPDGASFAATAAPPPGDANWWTAKLVSFSRATGAARVLYAPGVQTQLAQPHVSPDGKWVAFIGGLMSDQGSNGGDVFVVPAEGGKARNLTPGLKASASQLDWASPEQIRFGEIIGGRSGVASVGLDGAVKQEWSGDVLIHTDIHPGFSWAKDGTTAAIRESFDQAAEIVAGKVGSWVQVSHTEPAIPYAVSAKQIRWKRGGQELDGWLLAPTQLAPGQRYPMVVVVHGGPAAAYMPSYGEPSMSLVSQGYFVFLPNPRGSFGHGDAFTRGNVKDFGHGDLQDILAGVDAVLKEAPVDGARLGITGWSYGGYMTMFAVTQTPRFRAAVAGAGIANWQSYYGENLIDTWMIPYFGKSVYDDPAVYAKSSPITFIKHAKTPTLILVGERDAECPAPQSYEFWHALRAQNVPSQLVVYPGEGHRFRKPEHKKERTRRIIDWFNQNLQHQPAEAPSLKR